MKRYLFNWYDIKNKADNNFEGILVLTYASTFEYNKKIAKGNNYLLTILDIINIPNILYKHKVIYKLNNEIYNSYKCIEPQSYFINKSFFTDRKLSLQDKIIYLYLLSQRSIANNSNKIPKNYIDEKYLKHSLITYDDEFIYFIKEPKYIPIKEFNI